MNKEQYAIITNSVGEWNKYSLTLNGNADLRKMLTFVVPWWC